MKTHCISLILYIILVFCLMSCVTAQIKISPLHPYSASPTDYDSTIKKENAFVVKYFFVAGAVRANRNLCDTIGVFVKQYLKDHHSDYDIYSGYQIYFFRETNELNSNYRNTGTDNTPDSHIDEDLLLKYVWSHKEFMGCQLYEKGKVIKTVFSNKDILFKQ